MAKDPDGEQNPLIKSHGFIFVEGISSNHLRHFFVIYKIAMEPIHDYFSLPESKVLQRSSWGVCYTQPSHLNFRLRTDRECIERVVEPSLTLGNDNTGWDAHLAIYDSSSPARRAVNVLLPQRFTHIAISTSQPISHITNIRIP